MYTTRDPNDRVCVCVCVCTQARPPPTVIIIIIRILLCRRAVRARFSKFGFPPKPVREHPKSHTHSAAAAASAADWRFFFFFFRAEKLFSCGFFLFSVRYPSRFFFFSPFFSLDAVLFAGDYRSTRIRFLVDGGLLFLRPSLSLTPPPTPRPSNEKLLSDELAERSTALGSQEKKTEKKKTYIIISESHYHIY